MNDQDPKNWKKGIQHPSDDDVLCFIDGELDQPSTGSVRLHLEACWPCRTRADKFQSAISSFVDYRAQILLPFTETPGKWSGFDGRLRGAILETADPSVFRRWWSAIQNLRRGLQNIDIRVARLTSISAATILLLAAGLYILFISSPTTVSAEELLTRALATRERELAAVGEPVVFQQLRVGRRSSNFEQTADVELWQDAANGRLKQIIRPVAGDNSVTKIPDDLNSVMRASGYEPPPLIVAGYQSWRNSLVEKRDIVTNDNLEDGTPVLRLVTERTDRVDPGRIASSRLVVRQRDFHPVGQQFTVRTAEGDVEYEIRETSYAVMSLKSLTPGLFDDSVTAPMIATSKPATSDIASNKGSEPEVPANGTISNANTGTAPAVTTAAANADLEVEALDLLHGVGADLGEQIEVRRMANGPVVITGVVETAARKNQILNALSSVSGNPAVSIQINTVSEEIARQKQPKAQPKPNEENIEVETSTFPAEPDLRARFGDDDQAVRQFASRTIARSSSAMNRLWAMRRLKGQFSPADLARLTPAARTKWLNVIRSHARSYLNELGSLKRDLQPIFGGSSAAGDGMKITSDADLMSAIDQLFADGSTGNQVVRQAFTSGQGVNAIRTPQFWRTLAQAEVLARSIADAR